MSWLNARQSEHSRTRHFRRGLSVMCEGRPARARPLLCRQPWLHAQPMERSTGFYISLVFILLYWAHLVKKNFQIRSGLWRYKNLPSSATNCICGRSVPPSQDTWWGSYSPAYCDVSPPYSQGHLCPHLFPGICSLVSYNGVWLLFWGQDFLRRPPLCPPHLHSRCGGLSWRSGDTDSSPNP